MPSIMGRPRMMTKALMDDVCLRTFNGESMRSIARDKEMPSRTTISKELVENSDFAQQYARAREGLYQHWAEELLEIADDGTTDYITKIGRNGHEYEAIDQEHIQRSRLRVDARKWLLSKLVPGTYGDRVEHDHGGHVDVVLDIAALSEREKMRRMALFMLEARPDDGVTIDGELATPDTATMPTVDKDRAE